MAPHPAKSRTCALIAFSALLSAVLLTMPFAAWAQDAKPKAKAKPEQMEQYGPMPPELIEKRIAHLRGQMKITAPLEAAWNDFAQVMRDNSNRMNALIGKWRKDIEKKTALEKLKLHEEIAEEQAQAMRKLVTSFETLYNAMSEEQKKIADKVFDQEQGRAPKGKKR